MTESTDELSRVFQALADPTRRAIISRLRGGSTTVGELAEPFRMSRPAISQHLKVLERAGLIETNRRRAVAPLHAARPSPSMRRRRGSSAIASEWHERFDLLEERLREMKGQTDA